MQILCRTGRCESYFLDSCSEPGGQARPLHLSVLWMEPRAWPLALGLRPQPSSRLRGALELASGAGSKAVHSGSLPAAHFPAGQWGGALAARRGKRLLGGLPAPCTYCTCVTFCIFQGRAAPLYHRGWSWWMGSRSYNYLGLGNLFIGSREQRKETGTGLWCPGDAAPVYFAFSLE